MLAHNAAMHIGLPHDVAQELVLQTMLGSGHFMQRSGKPPTELIRMVASPGGTTEQALLKLQEGEFADLLLQAVIAAHNTAKRSGE